MTNKGIINSGGTFNVGQLIQGDNATINNYGPQDQRELTQRLDALLREISAARSLPPQRREQLTRVVDELKDEAGSESPDKSKFERGLAFVESTASSVSTIAAALKVVKTIVGLVF